MNERTGNDGKLRQMPTPKDAANDEHSESSAPAITLEELDIPDNRAINTIAEAEMAEKTTW